MRKLFALGLLIGISLSTFAERNLVRQEDIKAFLKTTTYVVLENNPTSIYNIKIKEVMEKNWTITPFKYITAKEFEEQRQDINKSFLVLIQMKFDKDKLEAIYNFLSVSLGAAVKKVTDMPDICSIPLSYKDLPEDSYVYKVEGLVRFIQNHIKLLNDNPQLIKGNIFDYYNNNTKTVKSKELWLLENDLEKSTRPLAEIRKNYKYTIKVVTPDDIEKAIEEKNPDVIFVHKVGPEGTRLQARCYKMLIGAADGQMYYYNMHNDAKSNGDGLLASDLKKIGKK